MGHRVADRQCGELFAAAGEECIGADHERACPHLDQGCEDHVEVAFAAGVQDMNLQPEGSGRWPPRSNPPSSKTKQGRKR